MLTEVKRGEEWAELKCLPLPRQLAGLLTACRTTEALEPPTNPACYNHTSVPGTPKNFKNGLHKSVHVLFTTLKAKEAVYTNEELVSATMIVYKLNYGLIVHKHPRPGIIHVFNKKFGNEPLKADEGPELGILLHVQDIYYRS